MQETSTFWAAIHSLSRAELAIIPTMKEEIQGYHMNPNYKNLVHPVQRNLRCHVVATVFLADGAPLGWDQVKIGQRSGISSFDQRTEIILLINIHSGPSQKAL